ncbi:putative Carboxylesterase [Nitrospira sp. KM1]|uniref:alpha/beta hydrolase n=1 Tax=Nitrospira sp. KM1 TaxID=1936990 RepID=UPI0013A7536C|nr:esterase [Nitrospira sp. KM1]BCA55221.1 putative Carboxylesterase [Nitrospira sp. KM1]
MHHALIGGVKTRITGGTDGKGGGDGPLVILLHGFGAPGDDLVAIGEVLTVPKGTRFLYPEGPLSLSMGYGESRAWWLIDMARIEADRAAGRVRDLSDEVPRGLPQARETFERFLSQLPRSLPFNPRTTCIGGFSQGAMLTADVFMRTSLPCAGLIQLSGTLIAKQDWRPAISRRSGVPVFQSHGMQDQILSYLMAERLRDAFVKAGLTVDWHSFRGGHEIPEPVLLRLGAFLSRVLGAT